MNQLQGQNLTLRLCALCIITEAYTAERLN